MADPTLVRGGVFIRRYSGSLAMPSGSSAKCEIIKERSTHLVMLNRVATSDENSQLGESLCYGQARRDLARL